MKRSLLPIALAAAIAGASLVAIAWGATIRVVDGDTVRVGSDRVRLVGLNAPEIERPACQSERVLGLKAKARLRQLVADGASLQLVPCSCRPGTEGTMACNYGRLCGVLRAGGRDVADILISEGLAAPYHCGATSCPPLPRPWCAR